MDKRIDFQNLFEQKEYTKIVSIIKNIDQKNLNTGLINLSGVCKLLSDKSEESLKSAINDFRKAYLKEKKKTEHSFNALKNFINASIDLLDIEFKSKEKNLTNDYFKEIFLYFNDNQEYFEKNQELIRALVRALVRTADVESVLYHLDKIVKKKTASIDAMATFIYYQSFVNSWKQEKFLEYSKKLDEKLSLYSPTELVKLKNSDQKKINIGFHSADIRSNHSITHFLKTVLYNYDKNKFNINIYLGCKKHQEDATTQEFRNYVDKIINIVDMSDIDVINLIRKDKIDILIDMMGFISNHRLSLYKNRLAPIQVSWCGFQNTTGIKEMDYIIVDRNLIYENEKSLYSEKIIYMDEIWNCHFGFDSSRIEIPSPIIKNKFITFGSFNNFNKINDDVIEVWSKILNEVKNSKLVLKSSNMNFKDSIATKFQKKGVLNSIEFLTHKNTFEDHINEYKKIDIALDTFPYNGVTTSFEAIWMGIPVITLKGFNYNSRSGESINKNLELHELIAENKDDYINIAINLEKDVGYIEKLRKKVFEKALKSPLFDKKKFSNLFFKSLEKIYK